jgi:hypothetical protein
MHLVNFSILVDHQLVEAEPHVKDDNFLSAADSGHIPPDLVVSANGYNLYFHCCISFLCSLYLWEKVPDISAFRDLPVTGPVAG